MEESTGRVPKGEIIREKETQSARPVVELSFHGNSKEGNPIQPNPEDYDGHKCLVHHLSSFGTRRVYLSLPSCESAGRR